MFFRGSTEQATAVKEVLTCYERQSGQSVNFSKSGIFYSANIDTAKQRELADILGVHNSVTNSNYLGLPSWVGRSKNRLFGFLKDSASKRIEADKKTNI